METTCIKWNDLFKCLLVRTMSRRVTFYSVNNARTNYNVLFAPVKIAVIYIELYPKENIYGM